MTETPGKYLEYMIARDDLHRLLVSYCRGMDRGDTDLLAAVFHDDAVVFAGIWNGPAREFVTAVPAMVQNNLQMCFHSVSNEWFEIDGDRAMGECYVVAFNRTRDPAAPSETIVAGRYLDRFERRQGVWKIVERTFVEDWRSTQASAVPVRQEMAQYGEFGAKDPLYRLWPRQ